jgi:hypothetical protein
MGLEGTEADLQGDQALAMLVASQIVDLLCRPAQSILDSGVGDVHAEVVALEIDFRSAAG